MTLTEIYEQQQHELAQFKLLRDQAWSDLQKEQQEITTAFGGRDKLPDDMRKRFEAQIDGYRQEWALDTGHRFQEMQHLHEQQRQALTGIKQPKGQPDKAEQSKADQLTDKQIAMQKIIRQQQATRKRQQENKRKR